MNAAGLVFTLRGMSARLGMAFYEQLVRDGEVKQDGLDGTRRMVLSIITELEKIPHEKIEALVSQFNPELTKYSDAFNAKSAHPRVAFPEAQIFLGFVSTILTKARVR